MVTAAANRRCESFTDWSENVHPLAWPSGQLRRRERAKLPSGTLQPFRLGESSPQMSTDGQPRTSLLGGAVGQPTHGPRQPPGRTQMPVSGCPLVVRPTPAGRRLAPHVSGLDLPRPFGKKVGLRVELLQLQEQWQAWRHAPHAIRYCIYIQLSAGVLPGNPRRQWVKV